MNARFEAPAFEPPRRAAFAAPLPAGTALRDCVVTGVIGQGGFGIVYRAEDAVERRPIADIGAIFVL